MRLDALVPCVRQVVDRERALDQRQLQLEAQHDVEVVGRLVGVDADQAALDGVDAAIEVVHRRARGQAGQVRGQPRQRPGAERAAAADEVLPQAALGLVHAERDRAAERAARQPVRDAGLVEPVPELVQRAEVRAREVVQVVARGDADVAGRDPLRERVRRDVQAPAVRVEADALEHVHHRAALVLDLVRAAEHPSRRRRLAGRGAGDQRHEPVAELGEQRPQRRGRHARLEVVEQDVVAVLEAREAVDVALSQLEMARERVAEAREVRCGARLLPRRLAERGGAAQLRGEAGRDAHRLLEVAPQLAHEAHVVGVRVLLRAPGLERVEQPAELGIGQALVRDGLERRRLVAAGGRAVRRHHRVLVPEQQRVDVAEVGQDRGALVQRRQLGRRGGHLPALV